MKATAKRIEREPGPSFLTKRALCVLVCCALFFPSFCGCKTTSTMRGQEGSAAQRFCSNCGKQPGGRYCAYCGCKIDWWTDETSKTSSTPTPDLPDDVSVGSPVPELNPGGGAEFADTNDSAAFVGQTSSSKSFEFKQETPIASDAVLDPAPNDSPANAPLSSDLGTARETTVAEAGKAEAANALTTSTSSTTAAASNSNTDWSASQNALVEGMKTDAANAANAVKNSLEEAKNKAAEQTEAIAADVKEWGNKAEEKVSEFAANTAEQAKAATEQIGEKFNDAAEKVGEKVDSFVEKTGEQVNAAKEKVEQASGELKEKVENQLDSAAKAVDQAAENAKEKEHSANKAEKDQSSEEGAVDPDDDRYWPDGLAKKDNASPLKTASYSKSASAPAMTNVSAKTNKTKEPELNEVAKAETRRSYLAQRRAQSHKRQLTVKKPVDNKK